jgi:endonuclease YncB( thermonuclease family)
MNNPSKLLLVAMICFFGLAFLSMCGPPTPPITYDYTPRPTSQPTSTRVSLLDPLPTKTSVFDVAPHPCIPDQESIVGQVTNIVDGDTIDVAIVGGIERVRLIGIDTPERGEAGFNEATRALAKKIDGRTITLWQDVSDRDRYDRLLAYIGFGDRFINAEMVREGFARPYPYEPDTSCAAYFQLQSSYAPRTITIPTPTAPIIILVPPTQPAGNCHPSYEGACLQIGVDYDCAGGSGNGPLYTGKVRVVGWDEYKLDRDGDGWGCE